MRWPTTILSSFTTGLRTAAPTARIAAFGGCIPVQRLGDGISWHAHTNHICSIGSLFGMHLDPVIDRRIRCDHNGFGRDCDPVLSFYFRRLAPFNLFRLGFRVEPATCAFERSSQTSHIFQGVKLCLSWKPKAWTQLQTKWRTIQAYYVEFGPLCGLEFFHQLLFAVFVGKK